MRNGEEEEKVRDSCQESLRQGNKNKKRAGREGGGGGNKAFGKRQCDDFKIECFRER